jgi:hypothetical protein
MNDVRVRVLLSVVLACFALACGKSSGNDQTLTTDVQAKLYADPTTKSANVNVAAKNGVVTLTGQVPSSDVELEAVKVANGTPGVTSVNDQIKVNPDAAMNQAPDPVAAPSYHSVSPQPAPPAATQPAPPPNSPPQPSTVTIPAGARVSVRMIDSIDSAHNQAGQVFRASLDGPLVSHGQVIVRAGAPVSVLLAQVRDAGRIKGSSDLEVRLSSLDYRGRNYPIDSSIYEEQGKGRGKQTIERTGIGAAAGAIIGAIAGGGKGAAIGSAAGGGAGAGFQLFTHGQQVKIPSESVLTFRLEAPLTLTR